MNRRIDDMGKKRRGRLIRKAMLCLVGLVMLMFIASTYRNHKLRESKEPYVKAEEVYPVAEAFYEVKKDIQENRKDDFLNRLLTQEYLTYGELLLLLEDFPLDNVSFLEDYKKENWYVGIEDWNGILQVLTETHGNGEILWLEQTILGTSKHITGGDGSSIAEGEVLTNRGIYENRYWNMEEYLFSNVDAICYGNQILTVVNHAEDMGQLRNVYFSDVTEDGVHFFREGYHLLYPKEIMAKEVETNSPDEVSRKIVDLGFSKGSIILVKEKEEYVHGKLLQVSEDFIEIEGHGIYSPDEDMEVYKLYGELASMRVADLRIGYSFTDFVIEDGKVAACLMIKEEDMQNIRVLLKNSNLEGRYHEIFEAYCNQECEVITYQNGVEIGRSIVPQGEMIKISPNDLEVAAQRIKIVPSVLSAQTSIVSIQRAQGTPSYFGTLEITRQEEGLLVVNEVLLEDYLCRVVPSEMPASYPKDALMTQAICARTYAYGKMLKTGLPSLGAHVDDSAGFQVYNNINEQVSTTEAVKSTHNVVAVYEGEPIGTYYYSTSCGIGSDTGVWHGSGEKPDYLSAKEITSLERRDVTIAEALTEEDNFREWITNVNSNHYESEEGWYRWTYEIDKFDVAHMEEVLKNRYAANPNLILTQSANGEFESKEITELGEVLDIQIVKRIAGGVADEMIITAQKAVIKVLSELNIRYVLSDGKTKVLRQSGDSVDAKALIPSAFIVIDIAKDDGIVTGYKITGGGFGHGVGMSQNGAKNMAKAGMTWEEIITFYYPGITLKTLQFEE